MILAQTREWFWDEFTDNEETGKNGWTKNAYILFGPKSVSEVMIIFYRFMVECYWFNRDSLILIL